QQDAFDDVDASVPLDRQKLMFGILYDVVSRRLDLSSKAEIRAFFTKLTGLIKNFHYAEEGTPDYEKLLHSIREVIENP
ncbi:MAG: V-type ATP synthase subunit A, partial [Pseudomonadota bacterium]